MSRVIQDFFKQCQSDLDQSQVLADAVHSIAPRMKRLLELSNDYLGPQHFQSDPDHYARNLVFDDAQTGLSLYTLVWNPGQWTPIHDHGTWGVVGILEGRLDEQGYVRNDPDQGPDRHSGIDLQRAGLVLLSPGSVSTFVPNPDHIHKTGCAEDQPHCVSLHLYGRAMNSFYAYDAAGGTRSLIEVAHTETRLGTRE